MIHQVAYALIQVISIAQGRRLFLRLPKDTPDQIRKREECKANFYKGSATFLLGFAIWNVDNIFCGGLTSFRANHGWLAGMLTQGHAWWHLLTGLGASRIVSAMICRLLTLFTVALAADGLKMPRSNSFAPGEGSIRVCICCGTPLREEDNLESEGIVAHLGLYCIFYSVPSWSTGVKHCCHFLSSNGMYASYRVFVPKCKRGEVYFTRSVRMSTQGGNDTGRKGKMDTVYMPAMVLTWCSNVPLRIGSLASMMNSMVRICASLGLQPCSSMYRRHLTRAPVSSVSTT